MAVTLGDVALATGVSSATVSRVVNGDPRISAGTRRRVEEALESMGYRGVRRGSPPRAMTAAFLIADPAGSIYEDLFFNEVLRGVAEQLEARGWHALVSPSDGRPGPEDRPPSVIRRADGVIAGGTSMRASLVRVLADAGVPAVFIGRYLRGRELNAVLPDNEEGARLATEHLLDLGRQTPAFIGGPPNTNVYRDRVAGFRRVLTERGLAPDERLVREAERSIPGGHAAARGLLEATASGGAVPDAIFAADDLIATGVLRAVRQRGLSVPDDVAIVGYSDLAVAAVADPPLSSVHVPKRRLGRTAAKLLLDLIEDKIEGPVQIVVPPHLVVRESSAGGAGHDARTARPEHA